MIHERAVRIRKAQLRPHVSAAVGVDRVRTEIVRLSAKKRRDRDGTVDVRHSWAESGVGNFQSSETLDRVLHVDDLVQETNVRLRGKGFEVANIDRRYLARQVDDEH